MILGVGVACFLFGVIVGPLLIVAITREEVSGDLVIIEDKNDGEKYFAIEMSESALQSITDGQTVILTAKYVRR